jgi:8-oxo-dGTP diphosphatase
MRLRASRSSSGIGSERRRLEGQGCRVAIRLDRASAPPERARAHYLCAMTSAAPDQPGTPLDAAWRAGLWVVYRVLLALWFVFRPRGRGVFVAVWQGGRVLAIRNSYRDWLALPGGGIGRGESPETAARRELAEEVGVAVAPGALRLVAEIPSTFEWRRDRCSFFEIELAGPIEPRVDRREVVWADFVAPEAALADHLAPPVRAYLEARARSAGQEAKSDR